MSARGVVRFPPRGHASPRPPSSPAAGGPLSQSGGRASVGGHGGQRFRYRCPHWARVPAQVSQDYLTNILLWFAPGCQRGLTRVEEATGGATAEAYGPLPA